jgi:hypothetical protein
MTWTVSSSKGICGYTNTYVFSPTGMTQVKTAPPNVAKGDKLCETFPPKTYVAKYIDGDGNFKGVPLGECEKVDIKTFGF